MDHELGGLAARAVRESGGRRALEARVLAVHAHALDFQAVEVEREAGEGVQRPRADARLGRHLVRAHVDLQLERIVLDVVAAVSEAVEVRVADLERAGLRRARRSCEFASGPASAAEPWIQDRTRSASERAEAVMRRKIPLGGVPRSLQRVIPA